MHQRRAEGLVAQRGARQRGGAGRGEGPRRAGRALAGRRAWRLVARVCGAGRQCWAAGQALTVVGTLREASAASKPAPPHLRRCRWRRRRPRRPGWRGRAAAIAQGHAARPGAGSSGGTPRSPPPPVVGRWGKRARGQQWGKVGVQQGHPAVGDSISWRQGRRSRVHCAQGRQAQDAPGQQQARGQPRTCMVLSERVRVPGTRLVLPMSFMKASQPCRGGGCVQHVRRESAGCDAIPASPPLPQTSPPLPQTSHSPRHPPRGAPAAAAAAASAARSRGPAGSSAGRWRAGRPAGAGGGEERGACRAGARRAPKCRPPPRPPPRRAQFPRVCAFPEPPRSSQPPHLAGVQHLGQRVALARGVRLPRQQLLHRLAEGGWVAPVVASGRLSLHLLACASRQPSGNPATRTPELCSAPILPPSRLSSPHAACRHARAQALTTCPATTQPGNEPSSHWQPTHLQRVGVLELRPVGAPQHPRRARHLARCQRRSPGRAARAAIGMLVEDCRWQRERGGPRREHGVHVPGRPGGTPATSLRLAPSIQPSSPAPSLRRRPALPPPAPIWRLSASQAARSSCRCWRTSASSASAAATRAPASSCAPQASDRDQQGCEVLPSSAQRASCCISPPAGRLGGFSAGCTRCSPALPATPA